MTPKQLPNVGELLPNLALFLRVMRVYKRAWVLVVVGSLSQILMKLPMPLLTGFIIDSVISKQRGSMLNWVSGALVITSITYLTLGYFTRLQAFRLARSLTIRFTIRLFRHLQILPVPYLHSKETGYLMARVLQDPTHLNGLVTQLLDVVNSAITFVVGLATMLVLSPRLTLFSASILPLFVLSYTSFRKTIARLSNKSKEQSAAVVRELKESIEAITVTKLLCSHSRQTHRVLGDLKRERDLLVECFRYESAVAICSGFFAAMGPLGVVWYGGHEIMRHHLTLGQFVAFSSLLGFLYGPTKSLIDSNVGILKSLVSLTRVCEILNEEPEGRRPLPSQAGTFQTFSVEFRDVSFKYEHSKTILSHVNISIDDKEAIGIIGPIGAGKTTLARVLALLEKPTGGKIVIGGLDVQSVPVNELRRCIGVVTQEPFLFSTSIYENIRIGKRSATKDQIIRAAELSNAYRFIVTLKDGFDTQVGEGGHCVSVGQKQLICLARTILADRPILILDEPTSSVDSTTEQLMLDAICGFLRDRTTIVISHRLSTLLRVSRIVVLENGCVTDCGTHDELSRRSQFFASAARAQLAPASAAV